MRGRAVPRAVDCGVERSFLRRRSHFMFRLNKPRPAEYPIHSDLASTATAKQLETVPAFVWENANLLIKQIFLFRDDKQNNNFSCKRLPNFDSHPILLRDGAGLRPD